MGRPKKQLPANGLDVIKTMAANGARECDIAAKLGVSQDTFIRIKRENSGVQQALAEGNAEGHEKVVGVLMKKALEGDTIAAIFLAKSKYGYRENAPVTADGGPSIKIEVKLPAALPADHYEKLVNPDD